MKKNKAIILPYKRKRQGKTYYKNRLKLLLSNRIRFAVRKSLKGLQVSLIKYDAKGDKVLLTVNSKSLDKIGWKGDNGNLPSAYLTGMLAGKKAISMGINDAVLDLGFNKSTKGSKLYASLAGAVDAGLNIPFNSGIIPAKERLAGEHIAKYALELKKDALRYERQFNNYLKRGLNPENITKHFNEIKEKING